MLLILFLTFTGFKVSAQVISTVNTSSPSACDGKAYLNSWGATNIQWFAADSSMTLLQTGSDSLVGLCAGSYTMTFSDSTGGNLTYDFIIYSDTLNPCAGFGAYAYVTASVTDSVNCNGSLVAVAYGGTMPYSYTWSNGVASSTISNLCSGSYSVSVVDANGCAYSASTFLGDSIINTTCSGFQVSSYNVVNASNATVCDGSLDVQLTGAHGAVSTTWSGTTSTGTSLSGLCAGYYTLVATDSLGCSITPSFYVGYNFDSTAVGNLYGWTNTVDVSADGVCDGQVYVEVYGGTAPYSVIHSTGATGQNLSNLCAGAYTVTVLDGQGDTLYLNYIIASPSNVINNGGFPDSTLIDTVSTDVLQNCDLAYFGIDSAFISSLSFITLDSIAVTWTIVDVNGSITITTTYSISSGAGVYEFVLQLFCPQRGVSDYLVARDQAFIDPSLMSVKELDATQISVYPNPFANSITIQLDAFENSTVQISDMTGKIVYNEQHSGKELNLNVESLAKGQYILQLNNAKGTSFTKLVK